MRIGFLGAGRVVSYQIERFKKYDDLEVVGFFDTDKTRCKEVSKLGYENFSSIEKLSHSDLDVISISTPSNQHYSSLLKVFNTKTKCKVITILGHDSFVNENISKILKLGLDAENNKELVYFGPLCKSDVYTGINMWQDYKEYTKHELYYLTGFFLTFPIMESIEFYFLLFVN